MSCGARPGTPLVAAPLGLVSAALAIGMSGGRWLATIIRNRAMRRRLGPLAARRCRRTEAASFGGRREGPSRHWEPKGLPDDGPVTLAVYYTVVNSIVPSPRHSVPRPGGVSPGSVARRAGPPGVGRARPRGPGGLRRGIGEFTADQGLQVSLHAEDGPGRAIPRPVAC